MKKENRLKKDPGGIASGVSFCACLSINNFKYEENEKKEVPVERLVESCKLIETILVMRQKRSEDGCLSKRNRALFNKSTVRLGELIGGSIIYDEERMEVTDAAYETIRAMKAVYEVLESKGEKTAAGHLFGLMLKIFNFRNLTLRSIRNYFYRGKDE